MTAVPTRIPSPSAYERVKQAIRGSHHDDFELIARELTQGLTAREKAHLLDQILPAYVRYVNSRVRMGVSHIAESEERPKQYPKSHTDTSARTRNIWEQRLNNIETVNGVNKRFSQCTATDLHWLGEERRSRARALDAAAERYFAFERELLTRNLATCVELPPEVGIALISS